MTTVTTSDGRTLSWTGLSICYCTKCEQLFNSPAAFDHHIRRKKSDSQARHDYRNMPRNSRGYLCTSLRDESVSTQHGGSNP
jgi:hypothetical protein